MRFSILALALIGVSGAPLQAQTQAAPQALPQAPQNPTLALDTADAVAPRALAAAPNREDAVFRAPDNSLWYGADNSRYEGGRYTSRGVAFHHLSADGRELEVIPFAWPDARMVDNFVVSRDASLGAATLYKKGAEYLESAGVEVWSLKDRVQLWHLPHAGLPVHSITFSPSGRELATGTHDGTLQLWDMATGKLAHEVKTGPEYDMTGRGIESLAYSPDGSALAVGMEKAVLIFNARSGRKKAELPSDAFGAVAKHLAWSPDNRSLAVGTDTRGDKRESIKVSVWDVASEKVSMRLWADSRFLGGLAWSPDGKRLALARFQSYEDRGQAAVDVWDVAGSRLLRTLRDQSEVEARSPLFSPDGQSLLSVSGRQIKAWSLAPAP